MAEDEDPTTDPEGGPTPDPEEASAEAEPESEDAEEETRLGPGAELDDEELVLFFLDVKGAFDRVYHGAVAEDMAALGADTDTMMALACLDSSGGPKNRQNRKIRLKRSDFGVWGAIFVNNWRYNQLYRRQNGRETTFQ